MGGWQTDFSEMVTMSSVRNGENESQVNVDKF